MFFVVKYEFKCLDLNVNVVYYSSKRQAIAMILSKVEFDENRRWVCRSIYPLQCISAWKKKVSYGEKDSQPVLHFRCF